NENSHRRTETGRNLWVHTDKSADSRDSYPAANRETSSSLVRTAGSGSFLAAAWVARAARASRSRADRSRRTGLLPDLPLPWVARRRPAISAPRPAAAPCHRVRVGLV